MMVGWRRPIAGATANEFVVIKPPSGVTWNPLPPTPLMGTPSPSQRVVPQLIRRARRAWTAAIESKHMRFHRAFRVLTSWIAVLAILMAALAPSISHALGAKNGASLIEVCTALGGKWVQPDGSSTDQAPASGGVHPFEHCPYCSLHANDIAIPVAPVVPAPEISSSDLLPTAFLAAPRTLYAWVRAQPRAPPQFS